MSKRPTQIAQIRSTSGEYYKYIRTAVKGGKYHAHARSNAVSRRGDRMGHFMLVFGVKYSTIECLDLYRDKDLVEKAFEVLKT